MHRRPNSGEDHYWCKQCQRGHLRGSLIGRLHKEYLAKGLSGKKGRAP